VPHTQPCFTVAFLQVVTFPVSWPLAKMLDWWVGSEKGTSLPTLSVTHADVYVSGPRLFERPQIRHLISLHGPSGIANPSYRGAERACLDR
jgi:hypothetical protein